MLATLFFMVGLLTCLNNILVPHLKDVFALGYGASALIQSAFFLAYLFVSLPSGWLIARIGYAQGLVLGLCISGAGALLFYPAAAIPSYPFFLAALFVLAAGITMIQVAVNPYVTILGKPETASSRLTLTQAFNSLGTTVAPALGGILILGHAARGARAVRGTYLAMAATLFVLAALVYLSRLPDIPPEQGGAGRGRLRDALRSRGLVLAMIGIFVYVGAEVTIGTFLVNFIAQPSIAGLPKTAAAERVSLYWGGAMVGRFVGAAALRKLDPPRTLGATAIAAFVLAAAGVLLRGPAAMWALVGVGLFNAIMFPTIFALGIRGLGPLTSAGSSLLNTSIVGGAVVPFLAGLVADRAGLSAAFILPALCYVYIAWFGLRGAPRGAAAAARIPLT